MATSMKSKSAKNGSSLDPKGSTGNHSMNSSSMNGPSTSNSRLNQMGSELYSKFNEVLEKTKGEVQEVQKKLGEYDERMHASENIKKQGEKASDFFHKTLENTKGSLDDLSKQTKSLFDQGAEIPMKGISRAIAALKANLEELKRLATEYDEKYMISQKVSDVVNPARERAMKYLAELSNYITHLSSAAYAQLQGVNDGLRQQFKSITSSGVNFLINTAASLDSKFEIENRIKSLDSRYKVTETIQETAKNLDEKFELQKNTESLLEKAKTAGKKIDERYIDGKVTPYLEEAYKTGVQMVSSGLGKLQQDFDIARKSSRENLAQMANGNTEKPKH